MDQMGIDRSTGVSKKILTSIHTMNILLCGRTPSVCAWMVPSNTIMNIRSICRGTGSYCPSRFHVHILHTVRCTPPHLRLSSMPTNPIQLSHSHHTRSSISTLLPDMLKLSPLSPLTLYSLALRPPTRTCHTPIHSRAGANALQIRMSLDHSQPRKHISHVKFTSFLF